MVDAVRAINGERPGRVADLLAAALGGVEDKRIAVLGLAFKPDTDDLRYSPGLALARILAERGAVIIIHDPLPEIRRRIEDFPVAETFEQAVNGVDAAVIATAWHHYAQGKGWPKVVLPKVILDGRFLLDGKSVPHFTIGCHIQPKEIA